MALQKARLPVQFVGGVETKADPKAVPPTKLLTLENGRFAAPGRIEKRNGRDAKATDLITSGKKIGDALGAFTRGDELLQFADRVRSDDHHHQEDGGFLMKFDDQADKWHSAGPGWPIDVSVKHVSQPVNLNDLFAVSLANANGYTGYVWENNTDAAAYLTIIEDSTGSIVVDKHLIGANGYQSPRIFGVTNAFLIFCADPANNDVYLTIVDLTDLSSLGAESAIITDKSNDRIWDACFYRDTSYGNCIALAYQDTTPQIVVKCIDTTGSVRRTVNTGEVVQFCLAVEYMDDYNSGNSYVGLCWHDSGDNKIKMIFYAEDLSVGVAKHNLITLAKTSYSITMIEDPSHKRGTPADSSVAVFVSYLQAAGNPHVAVVHDRFSGTVSGRHLEFPYSLAASRAFVYRERAYLVTTNWANGGYFLKACDYDTENDSVTYPNYAPRCAASVFGYNRGGLSPLGPYLTQVEQDGDVIRFAARKYDRLDFEGSVLASLVEVAFDFDADPLEAQVDRCTIIDGGFVGQYDGMFAELGFLHAPKITTSATAAAGGSMSDGTYNYKVVYEWTDREGQIHRSKPSAVKQVVLAHGGGAQKVTLTVLNLLEGAPHRLNGDVEISVYRTENGGVVYYKTGAYAANRYDQTVQTIDDTSADTSIVDNEALYTLGGVQENICPPPAKAIVARRDRVGLISAEDPKDHWFTKPKAQNVGLEFSSVFKKRIPAGGDSVALGVMDDKWFVFKARQIRVFAGQGPNAMNGGHQFTDDRLVTDEVGCRDKRSVVGTSQGLFFMSHKGIYLLGRNEQATYVGASVEDWNSETVFRARHVKEENQVRFLMSSGDILVYDYLVQQWATYKQGLGTLAPVDAIVLDGKHGLLLDDGTFWIDNAGYLDPGSAAIRLYIETAWIRRQGLMGSDMIWYIHGLGEYKSAHTLNIELGYDYESTVETISKAFAAAPMKFRIFPARPRCEAIKATFYDSDTTGESFSLSGLEFEVGLRPGLKRLRQSLSM